MIETVCPGWSDICLNGRGADVSARQLCSEIDKIGINHFILFLVQENNFLRASCYPNNAPKTNPPHPKMYKSPVFIHQFINFFFVVLSSKFCCFGSRSELPQSGLHCLYEMESC